MNPTRSRIGVGVALATHVVGGTVGLFIAFFVAYAFADEVTPRLHAVFLVGVVVVAAGSSAVAATLLRALDVAWRPAVRIATSTALVAYGAALGAGTLVSLAHEDQGSVTADQPDLPFLVLVAVCVVAVALGVRAVVRAVSRDA